ncbi:ClpXP protease specificity-enhancing factor [bacterium]|nr:ClpXP protease specificity-enhancing factor [bacterium]
MTDIGPTDIKTTSRRPYLLRAMYEWLLDNNLVPHLLVATDAPGVSVPQGYEKDGKIVLNIDPGAVRQFNIGNDWISFEARFGGRAMSIHVPPGAVLAIYGRDTAEGMMFDGVETDELPDAEAEQPAESKPAEEATGQKRGHLTVVK